MAREKTSPIEWNQTVFYISCVVLSSSCTFQSTMSWIRVCYCENRLRSWNFTCTIWMLTRVALTISQHVHVTFTNVCYPVAFTLILQYCVIGPMYVNYTTQSKQKPTSYKKIMPITYDLYIVLRSVRLL